MAQELSQEEVLDFLCRAGGRAPNAALLRHFGRFLRDPALAPEQRQRHRDCFKRYVNSVAVVKQEAPPPGGEPAKFVVLRARYRDLLGEDHLLLPPNGGRDSEHREELWLSERSVKSPPPTEGVRSRARHTCLGGGPWPTDSAPISNDTSSPPRTKLRSHDTAVSSVVSGQQRGVTRLPPSACPTRNGTSTPQHYALSTRGTSLPCPPGIGVASPPYLLPSTECNSPLFPISTRDNSPPCPSATDFSPCLPSVDGNYYRPLPPPSSCTSVPLFSASEGSTLPCPPSLKGTTQTFGGSSKLSSSLVLQLPGTSALHCLPSLKANCRPCSSSSATCLSSPEKISYLEPPFFSRITTQSTAYSNCKLPDCHTSPGNISTPWPPSPGNISPPFPPLDLFLSSKDEVWPPAYEPPFASSPPMLPGDGLESGWWGHLPVFKSIRCQLSLQELDDFVDQATNESLDSDRSIDSDSVNKNQLDLGFESGMEGRFSKHPRSGISSEKQYDHSLKKHTIRLAECEMATNICPQTATRPTVMGETSLVIDFQPLVLPLTNKSKHIMTHLRNRTSSSGDELMACDSQCSKKSRCPSHIKKAVKGSVCSATRDLDLPITLWHVAKNNISSIVPDVDLPATLGPVVTNRLPDTVRDLDLPEKLGPVGTKHLAEGSDFSSPPPLLRHGLSNDVLWPEFKKSSVVPFDPKEHDWVVKLASGSWMQVYGLFNEDPGLALRRDFISGYTALHWIAKHGNCQMFENIVSGAEKAGLKLDVDVKSSSGYTALHLAAIHGHVKLIKLLVEKLKVKVSMRDHSGKKAWQYLSSTAIGEVWQLLGAPRGKTKFPVCALPINPPVGKNPRSCSALTHLSRKTSLAAFLKPHHLGWKSHGRCKISDLKEVYSE